MTENDDGGREARANGPCPPVYRDARVLRAARRPSASFPSLFPFESCRTASSSVLDLNLNARCCILGAVGSTRLRCWRLVSPTRSELPPAPVPQSISTASSVTHLPAERIKRATEALQRLYALRREDGWRQKGRVLFNLPARTRSRLLHGPIHHLATQHHHQVPHSTRRSFLSLFVAATSNVPSSVGHQVAHGRVSEAAADAIRHLHSSCPALRRTFNTKGAAGL